MDAANREGYEAVQQSVGLIALKERGKVRADGPDRVSFLHNMISNDVEKLEERAGRHSTFLTAQGKIVAEFYIYKLADFLLLDLPSEAVGTTLETLNKYIIMDEVELSDCGSEWAHFSLQGPRCGELLNGLDLQELPAKRLEICLGNWQSRPLVIIHKADFSQTGFEVLLASEHGEAFRQAVLEEGRELGVREVGGDARQVLRIEAGIPLFGAELDQSRYPMEARLDDALDFSKGCYIGQEVVAKATYIGGVARLLARIELEGNHVPPSGSALLDADGRKVGALTSSTFSQALQRPIALGYVKKKYAQAGQPLAVSLPDQTPIQARVVERFL